MFHTVATHSVQEASVYIALVHNTCLFLWVIYKNNKVGEEFINSNISKPLQIATYVTLFSFVFHNFCQIFPVVDILYKSITCTAAVFIGIISYTISRYSVWLFGLLRIRMVFHSDLISNLGYKKVTLIFTAVIFTFCFLFMTITSLLITDGIMVSYANSNSNSNSNSNQSFCAYLVKSQWIPFVNMLLDQWSTIALFVLFYRKLKELTRITASTKSSAADQTASYALRKYTLLITTNVLSTWISLILVVFFSPISTAGSSLDSMINMWTIVLFDHRYDKLYKKIFGCVAINNKRQTKLNSQSSVESSDTSNATTITTTVATKIEFTTKTKTKSNSTVTFDKTTTNIIVSK